MNRVLIRVISICLVIVSGARPVVADNHEHTNAQTSEHGRATAVRSGDAYPLMVDPLGDTLAEVDKPVAVDYNGRELHFASQENAEAFKADPDKYLGKVDQMIIEQQKPSYPLATCVVSSEKLGGDMGEPVDYVYGNRLVRFCCNMCKAEFNKDPDAYLAKINTAVAEAQAVDYPTDTCVVSGDKFGGEMGEPVDYVIGTRLVRFCCPACVDQFEANPARYLSMLDDHAGHDNNDNSMHDDDKHTSQHEADASNDDAGHASHTHGEHH